MSCPIDRPFLDTTTKIPQLNFTRLLLLLPIAIIVISTVLLGILYRLIRVLSRPPRKVSSSSAHLLIVLGSGGHTAEMLNILSTIPDVTTNFTKRTYVVSSGDVFSAIKAKEFEEDHALKGGEGSKSSSYDVVMVRRARRVHQSFWTAPATALLSFWDCYQVLGRNPDMIITNGPGTGVCVVVASVARSFLGFHSSRTIYIESWARVTTLSLSGKILRPLVHRFLVQWPQLRERESGVEYIGPLVS